MIEKIELKLWADNWQNLFECLHAADTKIDSKGNFWAVVQELEKQFGYVPAEIPALETNPNEEDKPDDEEREPEDKDLEELEE